MDIKKLRHNTGQIPGVPKNPRLIKDDKYRKLVKSITDDPEMLNLRECIAYPIDDTFVVVMGNMRLTACRELGITDVPVKILPADTPPEKIRSYTVKDNVSFGEWDFDVLSDEWDTEELTEWGVDMPDLDRKSVV